MIIKDIVNISKGTLLGEVNLEKDYNEFRIDSRDVEKNDVFAAFNGENVDGHKYIEAAFEKGAMLCLIDNKDYLKEYKGPVLLVDNVLETLQELASFVRDEYNPKVIGITGSNGKTSTKNLVVSVLKQKYNVLGNRGNLNNHIGVPLTLLRLKKEHDIVVVEMGMNHLGEISLLSKIAKPDISLIVNVGTTHIGNLGSRENILKAKTEIVDGMTNGILITDKKCDMSERIETNLNRYKVSEDIKLLDLKRENDKYLYNVEYKGDEYNFELNFLGEHFVTNSLFAIITGFLLEVDPEAIKKGIKETLSEERRMNIIKLEKITLIDDAYNAVTGSMIGAIKSLREFNNYKTLILADMLELGSFSKEEHTKVGNFIKEEKIDMVITIGEEAKYISNTNHFDNNESCINYLTNNDVIKNNSVVLVKGSNGMKLKEVITYLKDNY